MRSIKSCEQGGNSSASGKLLLKFHMYLWGMREGLKTKARLDRAWSNLEGWKVSLHIAEGYSAMVPL